MAKRITTDNTTQKVIAYLQGGERKAAEARVGGHSHTTAMPGPSFGTPAWECITGSKLAKIPGSVCFKCYARKNAYTYPNTVKPNYRRFNGLLSPTWVADMAASLKPGEYFRWHDTGDVQSISHLIRIVSVAYLRPDVYFWLPTKEKAFKRQFERAGGIFPPNLATRRSAAMRNAYLSDSEGLSSMVYTDKASVPEGTHICPKPVQQGKCGDCRACWSKDVLRVAYKEH